MIIEPLTSASVDALGEQEMVGLLAHLTSRPINLPVSLQRTLSDPACTVMVAREMKDSPAIGMITLVMYDVLTGMRARIEDLVVVPDRRGSGVGAQLVEAAVAQARAAGAEIVDLTSNPQRQAANRLYLRLGFVHWPTKVYRLPLRPTSAKASAAPPNESPSPRDAG